MITMIDGQRVTSADGMRGLIDAKQPGDEITVTYVRSGGENTVHVTLTKRPS